jgi:hypothetical protein
MAGPEQVHGEAQSSRKIRIGSGLTGRLAEGRSMANGKRVRDLRQPGTGYQADGTEGRRMWDVVLRGAGWVLVVAVILWWARWTRREREVLGNGKGRSWE